jgi:hypothetical protein
MTEPRPETTGDISLGINNAAPVLMDGSGTALARGVTISQLTFNQNTLLNAARPQMTTRLVNSDGAASGKIIFEINGDRGKKQEFNFRALVATAADFTFIADGDNILAFDNVTQASKAVVFLNTGEQVCWTPPSRVSPGGPSVIEKTNTQCMSSINLDYSTSGNWN